MNATISSTNLETRWTGKEKHQRRRRHPSSSSSSYLVLVAPGEWVRRERPPSSSIPKGKSPPVMTDRKCIFFSSVRMEGGKMWQIGDTSPNTTFFYFQKTRDNETFPRHLFYIFSFKYLVSLFCASGRFSPRLFDCSRQPPFLFYCAGSYFTLFLNEMVGRFFRQTDVLGTSARRKILHIFVVSDRIACYLEKREKEAWSSLSDDKKKVRTPQRLFCTF